MYGLSKILTDHGFSDPHVQKNIMSLLYLAGNFHPARLMDDLENAGFNKNQRLTILSSCNNLISFKKPIEAFKQLNTDLFFPESFSQTIADKEREKTKKWLMTIIERSFLHDTTWQEKSATQIETLTHQLFPPDKSPKHNAYETIFIIANTKEALAILQARFKMHTQLNTSTISFVDTSEFSSHLTTLIANHADITKNAPPISRIAQFSQNVSKNKFLITGQDTLKEQLADSIEKLTNQSITCGLSIETIFINTASTEELFNQLLNNFNIISNAKNISTQSSFINFNMFPRLQNFAMNPLQEIKSTISTFGARKTS